MRAFIVIILNRLIPARKMFSEFLDGLSSTFYFSIGLWMFHSCFDMQNPILFENLLELILLWILAVLSGERCELCSMVGHHLFWGSISFWIACLRTRFEFSIVALENTPHPVMNREASSSKRMICSCVCSNQSACQRLLVYLRS